MLLFQWNNGSWRFFDFDNILLEQKLYEKSFENISIYGISYKTFMDANSLHIVFDKVDGFIKVYDETRYLLLFGPKRYNVIYDRIRYLVSQKHGFTYSKNQYWFITFFIYKKYIDISCYNTH